MSGESNAAPTIHKLITYLHLRESVMDTYLKVLDLQDQDISKSDVDKLAVHAQMEQELVERMEELQKVITALQKDRGQQVPTDEEQRLEHSFNEKCDSALKKNRSNQQKLKTELGIISHNLENIRRFQTRTGRNVRGGASPQSRFIDIET